MLSATEKLIKQFKKMDLPAEDRSSLIELMLQKVHALPIDNTIVIVPQGIQVRGKMLDPEQVINLRESTVALVDNTARKIVQEQLKYLAIIEGVHKGLSPDHINFSKAVLWVLEQEQLLIEKIVAYGHSNSGFPA